MVGSKRYISNAISTLTVTYVTVANNTRLRTSAQGIVVLKARGSSVHITLNDVLIVQNLRFNLLSAAQLMDCGVDLSTDPETRDILLHYTMPKKTRKQIGRAHSENGVYILDFSIPDCSGDSQELIDLVPLHFEHIHHRDKKHPVGRPWVPHHPHPCELALHDPDPDDNERDCRPWPYRHRRSRAGSTAWRRTVSPGARDRHARCLRNGGTSPPRTCITTSSGYVAWRWCRHLRGARIPRQSGEKLKIWQSDSAAEFRSKEMQDYLAQKGIEHHVSLPYAHQQQGVAERTNRTLMIKVRALMKQSKLPPTYWTYAMHHAVRVHNLLSTTTITSNSSPHVKWTGTKGSTSMLRVHEHKAWLILDLMSQKVKNARDVIFYERLFLLQFREDEQANANRVYANNGHSYASPEDEAAAAIMEQDPRGEFTRDEDDDDDSPGGGAGAVGRGGSGSGRGGSGSGRGAAPPAPPEPESDDDDVQEVIPQHRHDSTVSGLQLLGLHTATSTAKRVIEPKNPRQALTEP
ncbi:unnamed protein product [Closterium sp. NIES-54]